MASFAYLQSSFLLSAYISLIRPIDSISRSAIDKPNCTHLSKNNGVVISRSVGRSFFRLHIRLYIQSPQFNKLWQYLVDGKCIEIIKPLFRGVWNRRVCVFGHNKGNVLKHLKREHIKIEGLFLPLTNTLLKHCKVFISIPLKLQTVDSRNGCTRFECNLLSINLYILSDTHILVLHQTRIKEQSCLFLNLHSPQEPYWHQEDTYIGCPFYRVFQSPGENRIRAP